MEEVKYDVETGEELKRDIRPLAIKYKGMTKTFDMPGWYSKNNECEPVFTQKDLKVYDKAIKILKSETSPSLLRFTKEDFVESKLCQKKNSPCNFNAGLFF